jgi:hypothetical protein
MSENPDSRKEPTSYPGIINDYRRTHHFEEMLRPDIFLGAHAEWFNYEERRERAKIHGVQAWVHPDEYRHSLRSRSDSSRTRWIRKLEHPFDVKSCGARTADKSALTRGNSAFESVPAPAVERRLVFRRSRQPARSLPYQRCERPPDSRSSQEEDHD